MQDNVVDLIPVNALVNRLDPPLFARLKERYPSLEISWEAGKGASGDSSVPLPPDKEIEVINVLGVGYAAVAKYCEREMEALSQRIKRIAAIEDLMKVVTLVSGTVTIGGGTAALSATGHLPANIASVGGLITVAGSIISIYTKRSAKCGRIRHLTLEQASNRFAQLDKSTRNCQDELNNILIQRKLGTTSSQTQYKKGLKLITEFNGFLKDFDPSFKSVSVSFDFLSDDVFRNAK